jgi:hypothetical protein
LRRLQQQGFSTAMQPLDDAPGIAALRVVRRQQLRLPGFVVSENAVIEGQTQVSQYPLGVALQQVQVGLL